MAGTIDNADDFCYVHAMGIDDTYLYFRLEATDDVLLNEDSGTAIWNGDSASWLFGLYDMRPSTPRHVEFGSVDDPETPEPDWLLIIAGNAGDDPHRAQLPRGGAHSRKHSAGRAGNRGRGKGRSRIGF